MHGRIDFFGEFDSISFAAPRKNTSANASGAAAARERSQVGRFSPTVNVDLNLALSGQGDPMIIAPTCTFATPVLGGQLSATLLASMEETPRASLALSPHSQDRSSSRAAGFLKTRSCLWRSLSDERKRSLPSALTSPQLAWWRFDERACRSKPTCATSASRRVKANRTRCNTGVRYNLSVHFSAVPVALLGKITLSSVSHAQRIRRACVRLRQRIRMSFANSRGR